MRGQGRGDIDLPAIGMIDADTPRVEVHLAADAPGEERRLPTIFAVADDRMADRRHMNAQLLPAPGERLKLEAGGAIRIGRAHVCTPGTNAHTVYRLLLKRTTDYTHITS